MTDHLKRIDYIILSAIITVFIFIAIFTSFQIIDSKITQSEEIASLRLENIRTELESNLADAGSSLEKIAEGAQELVNGNAPIESIDEYIRAQKAEQIMKSDGVNFNAYIAGRGWEIIPDFDMPDDYHATERIWYVGAIDQVGEIYISEPYIDSMTGQMCYTMSKMLNDQDTVVAMDFTLSEVQNSITKMMDGGEYKALIVTNEGMIVGYSDMSLVGTKADESLPQYEYVLSQIMTSGKDKRFTANINGGKSTVFSSVTDNGWHMILLVDDNSLYSRTYAEIAVIIFIYVILLGITVYLYMYSAEKRSEAEKALDIKNEFLSGISEELKNPLNNIIKLSNAERINNSIDVRDDMSSIRASGLLLSQKLDNILSYSFMASEEEKKKKRKNSSHQRDIAKTIRRSRRIIVIIFILVMLANIFICSWFGYSSAQSSMIIAADTYFMRLIGWTEDQTSILSMFTDVIEADPTILDDYDRCVTWLNDISSNYPDISVCYIANPYREHSIIMNNGWQPNADWHVENRQWYKDTIKSDKGYSISAPYIDKQTNSYCITMSKVVYGKNEEFLGVFGIDFFMDKLINIFGEDNNGTEYVFLVDSNGNILNHPNEAYQIKEKSSVNIANTEYNMIDDVFIPVGFRDYNGKIVTGLRMDQSSTGFSIFVISEWWSVFGYFVLVMTVSTLLLMICIIIVVLMINNIIRWQEAVNSKLEESVKTAAAADRAKSQFLAQMSHEIRTPINAVIGMDEMIVRSTDDPVIKEYAYNINSAGNTLLEIVNGILDFSKIEAGKMEIMPVKYNTIQLVNELYSLIAENAQAKGLKLEFDIDPELPVSLFGDDVRLKQIILNLLTNAVKYTNEGSITLRLTGVAQNEDEYKLYVSVKDTGIGIKPEDMESLFASFQRLDLERNRNIEGTGLGISIVQGLLNMMGSELKVESIYGTGSDFYFEVDQKIIDRTPVGDYKRAEPVSKKDTNDSIRISDADILVVDDNEMNLKVASGLLKLFGVTPDLASSGKESIKMASRKRYDLIFMDHMMPGMDGIEALKQMVKEGLVYDTPVICLTANAVAGMREMYLEAGFNDYLAKPIATKELEKILIKYMPGDKIMHQSGGTGGESVVPSGGSPLEILAAAGFDTESGVEYSAGSEEFYLEMLTTFAEGYDGKSSELRKEFDGKDWENYRIHVHALKGNAKMIGAMRLAESALGQEMAAKEGRENDIINGFMPLMNIYTDTVETIRKALVEE